MEGEANLPATQANVKNTNLIHTSIKESPFPASSSSLTSTSSPEFLRNVQAAFKRRRPLNSMQSNNLMPRRILHPQRETPNNSEKSLSIKSKETVSVANQTQEDASITYPSISGTMTNTFDAVCNQNLFSGSKQNDGNMMSHLHSQHIPVGDGSRKVHFAVKSNATSQGANPYMDSRIDLCSHVDSLALSEPEWDTSDQAHPTNTIKAEEKQYTCQSMDMDVGLRADGVSSSTFDVRRTALQGQLDHHMSFLQTDANHPMTQSLACATSISVNATSAPIPNSTTFCSSSRLEQACDNALDQSYTSANPSNVLSTDPATNVDPVSTSCANNVHGGKEAHNMPKKSQIFIPNDKPVKGIEHGGEVLDVPSEGLPSKCSSDVKLEPTKIEKQVKPTTEENTAAPRKKNYDPHMFFKVSGKLYQRLGKIGSGGSSEVYKVISSDCKIYALKKIKLKGRDYSTAYGFCQEILYLNKLKGKNNIIQLIDYEVTDKALLEEVMNGSVVNKDGIIKDDGYIYMVLEYGEIDLAHMLSQKWKELESCYTIIDQNWLRFYWQQMLEAVNTIHEERIVHSDLKPANFLLVRGSLKLIDFGIAKAIMSDTTNIQRDAQVGTLSYMSPEAFMCNESDEHGNAIKCGRPSDIWSLGCILYQMVYGRTPFANYNSFWAKFKVITDPNHEITYEPVSNPWLLDLMKNCLAWERNKRWRIPQLLQHPFLKPPVPVLPNHVPLHQDQDLDQDCKAIRLISESYADKEVTDLCSQLQELLRLKSRNKRR
ncbi:hypothetical protein V2J09_001534 [Rumex salicifolius]